MGMGTERLIARDSVFVGDRDHSDPTDITFLFHQVGCDGLRPVSHLSLTDRVERVKDVEARPVVGCRRRRMTGGTFAEPFDPAGPGRPHLDGSVAVGPEGGCLGSRSDPALT